MPYGTPRNSGRALRRLQRGSGRNYVTRNLPGIVRSLVSGQGRSMMGRVTRSARNMLRNSGRSRGRPRNSRRQQSGRANDLTLTSDHTGLASKDLGVVRLGKPPKIPKMLGTYLFQNNNQWIVSNISGQQVSDFPEVLFTRNQLTGASLSSNRFDRYAWPTTLYELNPYIVRPNTTMFPGPHTEIAKADVAYIKSANIHFKLLSMVTIPQEVLVYWCMPKFDTDVNPIDAWVAVLAGKNAGANTQALSATLLNVFSTYGGAGINDVGANPFHHREFRNSWKCVKSSKVLLQAGEQVDLRVRFEIEKIINKSTLTDVRKMQFLAGLTIFPLVIMRTGLVGESPQGSGNGVPSAEVTHGIGKLGIWTSHQIKCGAIGGSRLSTTQTYEGTLVNSLEDKQIINDQDQVVNVQYQ